MVARSAFAVALSLAAVAACSSPSSKVASAPDAGDANTNASDAAAAPPTDDADDAEDAGAGDDADATVDAGPLPNPMPGCPVDPGPPAIDVDASAKADPVGSPETFTIAQAMAGYPETNGVLTAAITTELGTIRCELAEAVAPITVANFIGLARGTRPYERGLKWKVGRFYDGLLWHRVIPTFVIQGGDPRGKGTGGPGFDLPVENHVDEPLGTLAMAASDKPSGSQFFIVVGQGPSADYNVFGVCSTEVAIAISEVPRDAKDKPKTDVHMQRIDIARCPK